MGSRLTDSLVHHIHNVHNLRICRKEYYLYTKMGENEDV